MFDIKLVAYEPFGARIGELPQPLSIEVGDPLSDMPSMRLKYAREAIGAELLDRDIELAMEVYDPNKRTWHEPPNGRFLRVRAEGDTLDPVDGVQYTFPGYSWLLTRMRIYPLSASFVSGQVQDATKSERQAASTLGAAEDAVLRALGKKTDTRVEFEKGYPDSQKSVWIDTSDLKKPVVKVYVKNSWEPANATAQKAAVNAVAKWVEHQQTQGQLRDMQDRSRLTKRSFNGRHAGSVFAELLAEAKGRGRLAGLSYKFTTTHDSAGKPWPTQTGVIQVNTGTDLGALLTTFVDGGQLDFRTQGRELQVYAQNTAMARAPKDNVVLRYGLQIDEAPDRTTLERLAGEVLFMGDDGLMFTRNNPEAMQPWGVWESATSQSGIKTEAAGQAYAKAALAEAAGRRVERTRGLQFHQDITEPLPYIHYLPGDYVYAPGINGKSERQRVQQITLTKDGRKGAVAGNLVLNDRFLESEIRTARRVQAITNGTSLGGSGTMPDKETYVDLRVPEAPRYLRGEAQGEYVKDVGFQAYVEASWFWGGGATNGTALTDGLSGYEVQYRLVQEGTSSFGGNTQAWVTAPPAGGDDPSITFGPINGWNSRANALATYELRVRALGHNGKVSAWSRTAALTVQGDNTPPTPPTAPVARAEGSVLWVDWDGKMASGGKPPADFYCLKIHEATIPEDAKLDEGEGFSEDYLSRLKFTEVESIPLTSPGSAPIFDRPYGVRFAYAFTAVDFFGNTSELSKPSGVVTTTPLLDGAYLQEQLTYAREESERQQKELEKKLADNAAAVEASKKRLTAIESSTSSILEAAQQADARATKAGEDASGALSKATETASQYDELKKALDAALAATPGLIADPSFELPEQWQAGYGASIITNEAAHSGTHLLVLPLKSTNTAAPGTSHAYSRADMQVTKGNRYHFKVFLRTEKEQGADAYVKFLVRQGSTEAATFALGVSTTKLSDVGMVPGGWVLFEGDWISTITGTIRPGVQAGPLTSDLWVDDFQVTDATADASLQLEVANAKAAAEKAAREAQDALKQAKQAQTSADGKATIIYRTTSPQGNGVAVGDTWFQLDAANSTIGQWRWDGKKWVARTIEGTVLSNVDAGTITAGFISTERLQAGSISADKMVMGVGDNLIPWGEVASNRGIGPHSAAGSGVSIEVQGATPERAAHLLFTASDDRTAQKPLGTLSSGGAITGGMPFDYPCSPGQQYTLTVLVQAGGTYPSGRLPIVRTMVGFRGPDGKYLASREVAKQGLTWKVEPLAGSFVVPDGAASMYVQVTSDANGAVRVVSPELRRMTDASLIVNGSITGDKINGKSVAGEIGSFLEVDVKNLTTTGSANINEAVVNDLWAKKIATKKIAATEVIIGSGGNLIANGFGEMSDTTNFSSFMLQNDGVSLNSAIGATATFWTSATSGQQFDDYVPVSGGTSYAWKISSRGKNAGQKFYYQVRWYDAAQAPVTSHLSDYLVTNRTVEVGSWSTFNGIVQAPAGAAYAQFTAYCNHSNGTQNDGQWHRIGGIDFREATEGRLIVDGSISTEHIDAKTFDVTKLLRANSIEAQYLKVDQIKDAVRIDSDIFKGRLYKGAIFQGGEFRTHDTRDKGIAIFSAGMRVTDPRSGKRTFDVNASTGEVEITGTFTTGTSGNPSIRVVSSESSWNGTDQGVWFTYDGNPYGWGRKDNKFPVAGVFTTAKPGSWNMTPNIPLQLRGFASGGVKVWDNLDIENRLDSGYSSMSGSGNFTIRAGRDINIVSSWNADLSAVASVGLTCGKGRGIYLNTRGMTRYDKPSSKGGILRIAADGCIVEDLSSAEGKRDIQPAEPDERIFDVQPVTYIERGLEEEFERLDAEPRPMTQEVDAALRAIECGPDRMFSAIAEDVHDLGLTELVNYDLDDKPASLRLEAFALKLLPFVKELWQDKQKHQALTDELETLLPKLRELAS